MSARDPREVRFRTLLWGTAAVPIVLTLLASILLSRLVGRLLDDAQWVDHTDQVIAQARSCKESALAMESSLRAFELTARTNYVHSYWREGRQFQASLDRLRGLIADNPGQMRRLEDIGTHFSRWSNRTAMMLERLPPNQKIELEVLESGNADFAQFLATFDEFVRIEVGLREQRNNALERLNSNVRNWRTVI